MLTVSTTPNAEHGLEKLPISEILYMASVRKLNRIVVHTFDNVYYLNGTIKYWYAGLKTLGISFSRQTEAPF